MIIDHYPDIMVFLNRDFMTFLQQVLPQQVETQNPCVASEGVGLGGSDGGATFLDDPLKARSISTNSRSYGIKVNNFSN